MLDFDSGGMNKIMASFVTQFRVINNRSYFSRRRTLMKHVLIFTIILALAVGLAAQDPRALAVQRAQQAGL